MLKRVLLIVLILIAMFSCFCAGWTKGYREDRPMDPTYAEVKKFLEIERVYYIFRPNICLHLAKELREELNEKGVRAGVANLIYMEYGHAIIAFDIADEEDEEKYVYIDWVPQEIREGITGWILQEMNVYKGESYSRSNGLENPGFDDTIQKIEIIW